MIAKANNLNNSNRSDNKHDVQKIAKQLQKEPVFTEDRELEILKPNVNVPSKKTTVGFFKLEYALSTRADIILFVLATLGSMIAGASMPLISLLLGKVINQFNGTIDPKQVPDLIIGIIINFILAGIGIFIGSLLMVFFWTIIGKRLINAINVEYFRVIMRQEQGWFDKANMFEFATKVQSQIKIIENGIGNKVGLVISSVSQFSVSFIIGYITSWQLSLVITAMLPLIALGGWCMAKAMQQGTANLRTYEKAGGMAEEVLYQIKTVASFANFEQESHKYEAYITDSMKAGIKMGFKAGFGIGFIVFVIYSSYALAVGYGSNLISTQAVNQNSGQNFGAGDVITVLFAIIFGCFSLGQAAPNLKAVYEACSASSEFFALRERQPMIDLTKSIEKPDKNIFQGKLDFNNVSFIYPNSEKLILNNIQINFEPGTKIAIVGHSGSGKSTILSLIERFYDPIEGQILFDGIDIKNFDLNYWRGLIGYVPQEPVLFNTSIRSNIIFGREATTQENDIIEACDKAYATEFVQSIGLDYLVGIKGSKLSGGQKQRIAIARAILTKPKLLILDEATSALDNQSEKEVQKALDLVSKGVTTIIVAHKVETIMNSDKILCLDEGRIVEHGTHEELLKQEGFYYNLIRTRAEEEKEIKNSQLAKGEEYQDEDVANELSVGEEDKSEFLHRSDNILVPKVLHGPSEALDPIEIIVEERDQVVEKFNSKGSSNKNKDSASHHSNINDLRRNSNAESQRKLSARGNNSNAQKHKKQSNIKTTEENVVKVPPRKEETVDRKEYAKSRRKVMEILKSHKKFVAGAAVAAACNGAVWPIYGILFADAIGVLSYKNPQDVSEGGRNVALMFMGLAIGAAIVLWMQNYFFYGIGEILTKNIRKQVFDKFLNFHMGYFDRSENSPGSLLTKLSSDTTKISGVATSIIGQLLQTIVTLVLGITLALIYQWQLCMINICFMPLVIGSYILQFRVQKGASDGSDLVEIEAGSLLSESVNNTKTIFSYNMQGKVVEFYAQILKGLNKGMYKSTFWHGLLYSLSQFIVFIMYAVLFYVGGGLYERGEATFQYILRAIFTVLFAALGVGVAQAFVGDYAAAQRAIVSLYKIIDEESLIDVKESQIKGVRKDIQGKIEFRNVKFHYPTSQKLVFENLNFVIEPGQNVAFVGASGSGKSTIISLIERFYDVTEGSILIDDIDIKEYDLKMLRKNIGIVLQEPALFKRTIRENILYGRLDASNEEVDQAAKDANIFEKLSESENQTVTVSGGEKQRIAIARAILKDPKILLLDEATSALDRESENYVKESLNKLMKDRTSIVVAHRLSTIIACQKIFVLEKGIIVEIGSHEELLALGGKYSSLYKGSMA